MSPDDSQSLSAQVSDAVDKAENIIADSEKKLTELEKFGQENLIEYERYLIDAEKELREHGKKIRLDKSDLSAVHEQVTLLSRVHVAINAQIATQRKSTEQFLSRLESEINLLDDVVDRFEVLDTEDVELKKLRGWVENANMFIRSDNHSQLKSEESTHSLEQLKTQIEDEFTDIRSELSTSTEGDLLTDRLEKQLKEAESILNRLERVRDETDQEHKRLKKLHDQVVETDGVNSLIELADDVNLYINRLESTANESVEIAMFLDAIVDENDIPEELESFCEETEEHVRAGKLSLARKRVAQIITWESDLTPRERFEFALAERDGDLLRVVDETEFDIDQVLELVSDMYKENLVRGIIIDTE